MAGDINNPGDFEIEKAVLWTSGGLQQDLTPNIISITIYEDITSSAVSGQIFFQDAFALSSVGPLIGQEYLQLKIKTAGFDDPEAMIDYSENFLTITSVNNRADDKNGIEYIILNFVSSEQVINERTRVDRVLKGSYSEIVTKLLTDPLGINCRKDLYIEPTDGLKKIVSPNMTPFDLIHMAASESVSKEVKSPTFMFFETFRGYHFRSLDSLYVQGPRLIYDAFSEAGLKIHKEGSAKGSVDIMAGLTTLLDWEIVSGNDSLVNNMLGAYGSKLIVHDIFNKRFTEHKYNYLESFPTDQHIEYYNSGYENPLYSATHVDNKKNTVSDFPSRIFVTPTSIKDTDAKTDAAHHTSNNTFNFSAQNSETFLQRRNSQMIQSEQGFMVNILTLGNTVISAGDVVMVDIPMPLANSFTWSDDDSSDQEFTPDKWYKGSFLIKRIRHDFDRGAGLHQSNMVLVKDSLTEEIESSEFIDIGSSSQGTLTTDFYKNLGLAQLGTWI